MDLAVLGALGFTVFNSFSYITAMERRRYAHNYEFINVYPIGCNWGYYCAYSFKNRLK